MNKRAVWLAVGFAAAIGCAVFFVLRPKPAPKPRPPAIRTQEASPMVRNVGPEPEMPIAIPVLQPPAVVVAKPATRPAARREIVPPPMEVPIQNGATIDFSIGAPVVRSGAEDTAALEQGVREIDEAIKNVTFKARPPVKSEGAEGKGQAPGGR